MGRSSLLGTERAPREPAGRDTAALGPGDSSDSGSDMMGIAGGDDADPGLAADVALRDDQPHALQPSETLDGMASDASGTGERRSAGSDAGRDAADIGVDRVFTPGRDVDGDADDAGDVDLDAVDAAQAADPYDDEALGDDDEALADATRGPQPAARRRAGKATAATPSPAPHRPNPEPDRPEPVPSPEDGGGDDLPLDDDDAQPRQPGRG